MKVLSLAGSALLLSIGGADTHSTFVSLIPNGDKVKVDGETVAALGHVNAEGDGIRNGFGHGFETAGEVWTKAFCQTDSDGDGASNGLELGDPNCTWTVGETPARTTDLSHPGLASSKTTATESDADADSSGSTAVGAAERVGQGAVVMATVSLSVAALVVA
eukprot:CAMPEP_0206473480 /NCGR_PEP_ID=MMETSP0324_2-20121206/32887_1 /ASSEMBLY_ACC=CAM_ASM_000836 /TAXON_ID=2866 /ORGANISM="Crypthecodinium cohnii, Strain Seligo" /LENGTH=161 /DNA_ID=CAMNT_0053948411 /DNA_START=111 /DNA_END=596 /DNA_ORIENTATION=+